ncbi:MAG: DUF2062 domain-containing protein [Deltaproteobacteria bacterium]|nr:DUF2062 domain-containing protein [Deltaproteobacteria bacterium]
MKRFIPAELKQLLLKLLKSNSSTQEIADGLAIGMFVAFLPIMGIQMYVSLVLTRLFRKNSIVAMIAVWITNPITAIPIYLFNLWVGSLIYAKSVDFEAIRLTLSHMDWQNILGLGVGILVPLCLGSMITGLVAAVVSQRLCLRYYDRVHESLHNALHRSDTHANETHS